ncbi:MAG: class I SAM-dependent RNA methyltransferase [Hoeflea sp.]|uniref:class I SAM-dependent RNA methyltransferase n=1 Tax=Hoeflea sp. TaxID=1940281 RepID=UPI001DBBE85B|nr:class I SAM-dependent RNA methyltransferase [Hoeflea sp.]MBU4527709.1 class I SAM-dependent RNA methyltransferase [Alphaproteobacteria bacterium]MBU4546256.1 class I SAM-dependent RNA methyltransferase [Alphaproteobacteria bacterium]MBU4553059.1 class I SAM-dependent RNA methyltransferase [Alphaproteobacteria bacterium]MBV1724131.1 class I SAM-dependent RNA methyltransferase [Hoeflea sp.]MBV1759816.1 class I SAM-dependent RNA methyltransferase [Hoeflea sp.]
MSAQKLDITRLGGQGDGIAETPQGQIFVPFTLPGDVINAAVEKSRATLMSVLTPSPDRVTPPCPHFGPDHENAGCGGCAVQHMADAPYRAWKRDLVVAALEGRGIMAEVSPLVPCAPHSRRRVVFAARRTEKGAILGFYRAMSHQIVAIETCVIAAPRITQALPSIRRLATAVAVGKEPFHLSVLDASPGLDIAVDAPFKLSEPDRLRIITAVRSEQPVARLSFNGEILIEKQPPQLTFGSVLVSPPPGGFVQATAEAEEIMGELVSEHLKKSKRIVDLFSGSGTFALRLASHSHVHAVEADAPSLAALDKAARRAQGLKPVSVEKRDLFRRPMMVAELKAYQGLVFDPPRAGAEVQVADIARSPIPRLAAVSCNPVTLARDLEMLIAGGYRVMSVTPIDQFLWTSHVEVVALLERPKR